MQNAEELHAIKHGHVDVHDYKVNGVLFEKIQRGVR
jgi:hypothetical protein